MTNLHNIMKMHLEAKLSIFDMTDFCAEKNYEFLL